MILKIKKKNIEIPPEIDLLDKSKFEKKVPNTIKNHFKYFSLLI